MNKTLVEHVLTYGKEGEEWLDRIPDIIREFEKRWSIRAESPFTLNYNYVAPAVRLDGTQVVLKIGFPKDREFRTEIDALTLFNGDGIERVFEIDYEQAVILIERVIPGVPLSTLDDDDAATRILASVMKKLWKPLPPNNKFITISEWMKDISQYIQKYKGRNGPLPLYLIQKADNLFKDLIETSQPAVLVHGDLHHDNVLSSDRDNWLAIDPKGIAAEPAYETAAMIRNPYIKMNGNPNLLNILRNRITILAEELGFDPKRIQQWCFAQTVLSAVWNDAGIKGSQHTISIAEALEVIKI